MDASPRSGRPPLASTTRSTTCAPRSASVKVSDSCSTAPAPACSTGAVELGRTVMMGVPVATVDCTATAPPKICCSATSSGVTPTASVSRPLPVFTASRAAISLPSAVLGMRTARGLLSATSWASAVALGATRYDDSSSASLT